MDDHNSHVIIQDLICKATTGGATMVSTRHTSERLQRRLHFSITCTFPESILGTVSWCCASYRWTSSPSNRSAHKLMPMGRKSVSSGV